MNVLKDRSALKYTIKDRHIVNSTRKGAVLRWMEFYRDAGNLAGVSMERMRMVVNCRRDSHTIATAAELAAFAQLLECTPEELGNEAAERVVQP